VAARTPAPAAGKKVGGHGCRIRGGTRSAQGGPSRAFSRNKSCGNPAVFRIQADQLDNEAEFIGAVDLARYAVGHIGPDELGFDEGYSAREIKTR